MQIWTTWGSQVQSMLRQWSSCKILVRSLADKSRWNLNHKGLEIDTLSFFVDFSFCMVAVCRKFESGSELSNQIVDIQNIYSGETRTTTTTRQLQEDVWQSGGDWMSYRALVTREIRFWKIKSSNSICLGFEIWILGFSPFKLLKSICVDQGGSMRIRK